MSKRQLQVIACLLWATAAVADTFIRNHEVVRFIIVALLCFQSGVLTYRANEMKAVAK